MTFSPAIYGRLADLAGAFVPPSATALSDDELLAAQRALGEIARRVEASAAVVAGEIAHRSRPALGHSGLAQARGMRTPELLVQQVAGGSKHAARTLVRIGSLLTASEHAETGSSLDGLDADGAALDGLGVNGGAGAGLAEPWLVEVVSSARSGALSLEAVDAIRVGLGSPTDAVGPAALADAAARLLVVARELTLERLAIRAREERAQLDDAIVAEREELLRSRRFLHLTKLADGMTRVSGLLDPESAAIVSSAFDNATSPRRGGPRFVDLASPTAVAAAAVEQDPRTSEQVGLDALVDLIRIGGAVSPEAALGGERPAVRLHVRASDLHAGTGFARLEGQSEPVALATAERHLCDAGAQPIGFDATGQPLDVGRAQRLFTYRQRVALAARDGGCRAPGCDRPPSWCEAHHLLPWENGGRTDVLNGLLLCRHHHLLVHNNGWTITRRGAEYWFAPPPEPGGERQAVLAPPNMRWRRRNMPAA